MLSDSNVLLDESLLLSFQKAITSLEALLY